MKNLIYLSLAFIVVGCGSSSPTPPVVNPAKNELAEKLKAMSPDERKEYFKTHPDEVRKALGGPGFTPQRGQ